MQALIYAAGVRFHNSVKGPMKKTQLFKMLAAVLPLLAACSSTPDTHGAQYEAGLQAKQEGDLQEAFSYLEKTVERDPGHRRAQLELVSLHMDQDEPDHAVAHLTNLIDHIKQQQGRTPPGDLYARRGRIYYQAGNYEKAIRDTSRALELDSQLTDTYNTRGLTYLAQDKLKQAKQNFRTSIDVENNAEAFLGLAKTRMRLGEWKTAIEQLNQAIEINSEFTQAYRYRAVAHRELGRVDRMKEDLKTYLTLTNPEVTQQEIREQLEKMMKKYREKLER